MAERGPRRNTHIARESRSAPLPPPNLRSFPLLWISLGKQAGIVRSSWGFRRPPPYDGKWRGLYSTSASGHSARRKGTPEGMESERLGGEKLWANGAVKG